MGGILSPDDPQPLKILYLSAECVPFAKTGGLADVAGALPKAIRGLGHDIRIVMPRYGRVEIEKFGLRKIVDRVDVPMDERTEPAAVYEASIGAGAGKTPVSLSTASAISIARASICTLTTRNASSFSPGRGWKCAASWTGSPT